MDLFKDIIPSILVTGKSVLNSPDDYKNYVPFVVNKALSFHLDCVLLVNEINIYPSTPKEIQYSFLLNSVRHYKRPYQPWVKKEKLEDIKLLKEHYKCSDQKAREFLTILTRDQLNEIKNYNNKGGIK